MRPTRGLSAGVLAALLLPLIWATPAPAQDQNDLTPFAPPAQYTANSAKPFDALKSASTKWLQAKVTDRKRKRRFQDNNSRLPDADKKAIAARIVILDGEIKETGDALAVLTAKKPDLAAQKQTVKATVSGWIAALAERATALRKDAEDALDRGKKAVKQFDIARAQADANDAKQNADNAEKEAKALTDDLAAAAL